MSAENIHLTSSEWHVMEFLWDHTPCTGREATSCLEKTMGWSRSTTLTLLRRLRAKGQSPVIPTMGKSLFAPLSSGMPLFCRKQNISCTAFTMEA